MPTKQNNITIYISPADEELIEKASKIISLQKSAFCRSVSVQKARELLGSINKNKLKT